MALTLMKEVGFQRNLRRFSGNLSPKWTWLFCPRCWKEIQRRKWRWSL